MLIGSPLKRALTHALLWSMTRAFLIRFNCSGVRLLKNSPSSRMRRYGAAAFAASILRHMGWGWDLSRIIASMNCRGSALGGRQRGSNLIKPGVGKRPCFIGNGRCGGGSEDHGWLALV
jgi:hypothetical protein